MNAAARTPTTSIAWVIPANDTVNAAALAAAAGLARSAAVLVLEARAGHLERDMPFVVPRRVARILYREAHRTAVIRPVLQKGSQHAAVTSHSARPQAGRVRPLRQADEFLTPQTY